MVATFPRRVWGTRGTWVLPRCFSSPGLGHWNRSTWIWSQMSKSYVTSILAESPHLIMRCRPKQVWKAWLGLEAEMETSSSSWKLEVRIQKLRCGFRTELWPAGPECTEPSSLSVIQTLLNIRSFRWLCQWWMGCGWDETEAQASVSSQVSLRCSQGWNCKAAEPLSPRRCELNGCRKQRPNPSWDPVDGGTAGRKIHRGLLFEVPQMDERV